MDVAFWAASKLSHALPQVSGLMTQTVTAQGTAAAPSWQYHGTKQLQDEVRALTNSSECAATATSRLLNTTSDGWPIEVITVGTGKAKVLLAFGIHGREYLSSEIGYRLLKELCTKGSRAAAVLDHVSIAIVPVLNPSGRHRTDLNWLPASDAAARPAYDEQECVNRRKNANLVDLNRNFDVEWSDPGGSSGDEGDADYRGAHALSEVEAATLDALAAEWQPHMFIDVHTGTVAMYACYNFKDAAVEDEKIAGEHAALLRHVTSTVSWTSADATAGAQAPSWGIGGHISYLASGTTADHMYKVRNVPYSFIWETYEEHKVSAIGSAAATARDAMRAQEGHSNAVRLPRGARIGRRGGGVTFGGGRRGSATLGDAALQPRGLLASAIGGGAAAALQPEGVSFGGGAAAAADERPTCSLCAAEDWVGDDCFEFFNPATTAGVEHYTRTWSDALVTGIEYFSDKLAPGLKLNDNDFNSLNGVVVASNHSAS